MRLTGGSGPVTVVCLAAHPDDVEIGCGATLLALRESRGISGAVLTMTGGAERQDEARDAARAFTADALETHFAGLPDGRLPEHWGAVKTALHEVARRVPAPDLVFAPRPDDAHQDHRLVGELTTTVWRGPTVLHYEIPKWDGDLARPNVYVPVTAEQARRKIELLTSCYPSQVDRAWWDDEMFLGHLRIRGIEAQHRYAEAFTTYKTVLEP
ncbi:PIG-L deacetylase family protein [Isoptericola haloaureus]|uniref:PIG-L deacetylase family protein n=1 Tax=Isoptericola haloaureus TaxID=1542902 RepID=A0ABU7Z4R5_9MICO